jgi:hypothetical protein
VHPLGSVPPAKLIERPGLRPIGHAGLEAIHVNHMIGLALADAPTIPVESVLSAPDQGTYFEGAKAKLLSELAPQGLLKAFAWLQTAARHDPKRLTAIRCANSHEENFLRAH